MLTPAATKVQHQLGEARDQLGGRLQCLRCGHDFKPGDTSLELDSVEGWRPLFQNTGISPALDLLPMHFLPLWGKWLGGSECGGVPQGRKEWGPLSAWRKNKTVCLLHLQK